MRRFCHVREFTGATVVKGQCSVTAARTPLPALRVSLCINGLQELLLPQISYRLYQIFFPLQLPYFPSMGLIQKANEMEPEEKSHGSYCSGFIIIHFLKGSKLFCHACPLFSNYDFYSSRCWVSYVTRLLGELLHHSAVMLRHV